MGGFFGVASNKDCVFDLFFGTDYHSHLGTRRGGMAVYGEDGFDRAIHNIQNSPFRTKFERDVDEMKGNLGIGCISDTEPQPLIVRCLVPIELKIGKFKPEHIGQINFYLEALDRDVKKPNENPSVGLILCASKDDAVVEYALSRSMSPTLVSDYTLCLPDKQMLKDKLQELAELVLEGGEDISEE